MATAIAMKEVRQPKLLPAPISDFYQQTAVSKAFTTSKSRETVSWVRELLGGNGILVDHNVARFFADAEALYAYEGTYQMRHPIVGKAITGFSAFA